MSITQRLIPNIAIAATLALVVSSGCTADALKSRWAMDHPEYKERYKEPYNNDHFETAQRKVKQAVDARFVDDDTGWYVGGMGGGNPATGGGEIGAFHYPANWLELRAGMMAFGHSERNYLFYGGNLGARIQTPTRIAPFVGVGTFLGMNSREVPAENDRRDNDDDHFIDEYGEMRDVASFAATVYPEAGVHFWITPKSRITASAAYQVSTLGRDADTWTYGLWWSGLKW